MDGHWYLQVLLGETGVFVMPPCNVMLRLTEAESLGNEGKLAAADTISRGFWRQCWRNNLALCDPIIAAGLGGRSQSCGEISTSYSSRTVASMEKPSVQSTFSALCCWEKTQNIRQSQAPCEMDSCVIPHYVPVHWTSTVANLRQR